MNIIVYDGFDEIYNGDADSFLEENDYDTEIEELLNELEGKNVGDTVTMYGNQCAEYIIEKTEDEKLF